MKLPLGRRIFLGTALVVVAVLGSALLVDQAASRCRGRRRLRPRPRRHRAPRSATRSRAGASAPPAHRRPWSRSPPTSPASASRSAPAIAPTCSTRPTSCRGQTGADWVLITDGAGVLQAWTAQRGIFDEDFSGGALIGRAMEGAGHPGLWLEPRRRAGRPLSGGRRSGGESRQHHAVRRRGWRASDRQRVRRAAPAEHRLRDPVLLARHAGVPQVAVSTLPRRSGWRTRCAGRRSGKSTATARPPGSACTPGAKSTRA